MITDLGVDLERVKEVSNNYLKIHNKRLLKKVSRFNRIKQLEVIKIHQ
jgi:hypothetical protein